MFLSRLLTQPVFSVSTDWPGWHNFQVFKLEIENVFMVNWFGGRKSITVYQYLNWKMSVKLLKHDPAIGSSSDF